MASMWYGVLQGCRRRYILLDLVLMLKILQWRRATLCHHPSAL